MQEFLEQTIEGKQFELTLDTQVFPKDIILKSAFSYLDLGYFFFKLGGENELILQFTAKEGVKETPEKIIGEFSDTLLEVYLRDKLEKDNKVIREAIVTRAMSLPLDTNNFVSIDTDELVTDTGGQQEQNKIDFNKDIDEILKEIENDPELQIDEGEIEKILKEIEEEEAKIAKPTVTANLESLKKAKNSFNK